MKCRVKQKCNNNIRSHMQRKLLDTKWKTGRRRLWSPDKEFIRLEQECGSRVRSPSGAGNFSLHHRVQNGSGAHPASYPMGIRGSFPGGKAAGA
jgi:hypothetical protein